MERYETRYALSNTEFEIEDYETIEDARDAAMKRTGGSPARTDSTQRRALYADVLRMDKGYSHGTVVFRVCGSRRAL